MNWHTFSLKFNQREEKAFEDLSSLLFCERFNNKIGLFRYKNQAGIETKPIVDKDGNTIGFQAKYCTNSISKKKVKIIDSIQNAKKYNNSLNKILLYVNKELSENTEKKLKSKNSKQNKKSSKKLNITDKRPKYQIDIENEAQKLGIEIEWQVPSHIERQILLPENKYIYDIFFNLDQNSGDLIDEIKKHNDNILRTIQSKITYNESQIKIDRNCIITQIKQAMDNSKDIIISGEGGCGKTAVFKEFYYENKQKYPICIFKASELNINNINDLFRFNDNFSFKQFLETYDSESKKIFVIDSSERLAELTNNDILNDLIFTLKENGWNIIFTTRYSYLNDLLFHIKESYQLYCDVIDIPLISDDDLKNLSIKYNFIFPDNQNFLERLKNLFYLNQYIQNYSNIEKQMNFKSFIDIIWKKQIQNFSYQKDNIHLEREKSFIYIVKERCRTGLFYISAEELQQTILFQLKRDEILGYDENHKGYFITHDIYEEWALERIISTDYSNYVEPKQFFDNLGDSLPIRRAFRLWLSEQLYDNVENIKELINDTFINNDILQHWKDELIVSILLSNYADVFFTQFEKEIIANNFNILNKILFLLRIACKEDNNYIFTKPKGKGWEVVITFIYKYRNDYFESYLNLILPVLTDWVNNHKEGEATRFAGLLALSLIDTKANTEQYYFAQSIEEDILKIIYKSAKELKSELQEIFDNVITNKWVNHNDPYEDFCSMILKKPLDAIEVIRILPLSIIQLCDLFWQKNEMNDDYSFNIDMEKEYGIADKFDYAYFPAGALQTPIFMLLQYAFYETLDFIIDFTNKSIEYYRESSFGKNSVREIILCIEGKEVKQYLCWAFWGMYRGISNPVVPDLLQSIHMALEKILLSYAQSSKPETIEYVLLQILTKSKSTSLTAVVCSIVLANPNKFYNIALILFKTIELFHIDTTRRTMEFEVKSLHNMGYGWNKEKDILYADERLKTCEDKHRDICLETLFINYEFFEIGGATKEENKEFIQKLYGIIDQHKIDIQEKSEAEQKAFGILLARMDRRVMKPIVKNYDDSHYIVELNPQLSPELREHSEKVTQETSEFFRYIPLNMWSILKNKGDKDVSNYLRYENNPLSALEEIKEFMQEAENGTIQRFPTDANMPYFVCSALIRFYREQLNDDELNFCKNIIIESAIRLFSDDYNYQIIDGVEAAIHAIPSLITVFPEDKEDLTLIMLFVLFDRYSLGAYKRICDYVVEAIYKSDMWSLFPNDVQSILLGFIKLKPIYNQTYFEKMKMQDTWGRISKSILMKDFKQKITEQFNNFSFNDLSFDIQDVVTLDINDLEIIYQLIPSNTHDKTHLDIYKNTLPIIIQELLVDRRKKGKDYSYSLRLKIFKRFAYFILERNIDEIDNYLQPFIDSFDAIEEASFFLNELISAEDYKTKYEQFWYIWGKLYPKFIEICCKNSRKYHLGQVVRSYLLAWQRWKEDITEWHSLKKENLSFYKNTVDDIGDNPNVLYSISEVLTSIGSKFLDEGIDLVYNIISKNKSLELKDLKSAILYNLEKLMRNFIFINREKIRRELKLKNKVILILGFMIELGSVRGYLLRENIL
jgi:hypothetical protein